LQAKNGRAVSLRRCRRELELSFAAFMRADRLFQSEGPLEFRSATLLAYKLAAEIFEHPR
jgi:hypothetical protein